MITPRLLLNTALSSATSCRCTPAPTGLRNMAQMPSEKTISIASFGCFIPGTLRLLADSPFSVPTSRRRTPAPTGLRSTAQGQPSLGEATLGFIQHTGKQTQHSATTHAHQQRLPIAPPHIHRARTTLQSTNPRSARLTARHSCSTHVAAIRISFVIRHSDFVILPSCPP